MTTLVTIPLAAATLDELRVKAEEAHKAGADLLELRLDLCQADGADIAAIEEQITAIPSLGLPVLATIRHQDEGGQWQGSETERLRLLRAADEAGAHYVDIELAHAADLPGSLRKAKLVLSYHDFHAFPDNPSEIIQKMYERGADVAKIAVHADDAHRLATIEALYREFTNKSLVAIAMGEHGLPSRLLAGCWGATFTFGALNNEEATAPGQVLARDLKRSFRIHLQGPETCIFGVLGNPVGHSISPAIHNACFKSDNLDAVYVPFRAEDAERFWESCGGWIDGLSITIPHKVALINKVDEVEELAAQIGAINTIYRNETGESIGANTDADAAMNCVLGATGSLENLRCLILGAGGVSRAIAYALHNAGAQVTITNRTIERARELAEEVGCQSAELNDAKELPYTVLINCTSVGMNENNSPWPEELHRPETVVFDTVYTPLETKFLREGNSHGAEVICGLSMFVGQAIGQYQRWCDMDAPVHTMKRASLEALGHDPEAICEKYASATKEALRNKTLST